MVSVIMTVKHLHLSQMMVRASEIFDLSLKTKKVICGLVVDMVHFTDMMEIN